MAPSQYEKLVTPPRSGVPRETIRRRRTPSRLEEERIAAAQWRALTMAVAAAALCALLLQLQ